MQVFAPNYGVNVVHALRQDTTGLRYRVLDQSGAELLTWTQIQIDLPAPENVVVTVPGGINGIPTGELRAVRVVEFEVTTPSGVVIENEEYALGGLSRIEVGTNSFVTYYEAVLLSDVVAGMEFDGWQDASRQERENALLIAYESMRGLTLMGRKMTDLTDADIDREPGLREALRKAQVIEASDKLVNSPIRQARREGVISMTVGESSQFFGSWRPVSTTLCASAMRVLGRWMTSSVRIYRA
jgi:hypothetical protein